MDSHHIYLPAHIVIYGNETKNSTLKILMLIRAMTPYTALFGM